MISAFLMIMLIFVMPYCYADSKNDYFIDGYQSAKFGMSQQQLKETHICTLNERWERSATRLEQSCNDLVFDNKKTHAGFVFIEDKLTKIYIYFNPAKLISITENMRKRYGNAVNQPEFMARFDAISHMAEGSELLLTYPNQQVYLKIIKVTPSLVIGCLVYQDRAAENIVTENSDSHASLR